ncbi:hypothetical protein [Nitrospira sp.]|uniref:hypothetical protein n=1 Tax=Nitrospira sp. TaxID=70125 RepID=UPI003FCDAEEF
MFSLPGRKGEDSFHGRWRWVDVEHHFTGVLQIPSLLGLTLNEMSFRHLGLSSYVASSSCFCHGDFLPSAMLLLNRVHQSNMFEP